MDDSTKPFGEPIFTYTSEEAVKDGILLDLLEVNPAWEKGLFRYVTTNLLAKGGYLTCNENTEEEKVNIPNLLDLLNQAQELVRKKSKNFTAFDTFFSGKIEAPSGERVLIFIEQNEVEGKFTILLPEDH